MTPLFDSPITALVAGLVTSVHCVGMCGPLACATTHREHPGQSTALYHSGRLVAYMMLGGLGGLLGASVAPYFNAPPIKLLPAAFALFFIIVALGWDKRVRIPLWLTRWSGPILQRSSQLPKPTASLLLGLGTPFLPCAPLYLALGVALFSGSFLKGAILMGAFVLGTIPALAVMQLNWSWLSMRITPIWLRRIQRGLALLAAVLILWRSVGGATLLAPSHCPLCH